MGTKLATEPKKAVKKVKKVPKKIEFSCSDAAEKAFRILLCKEVTDSEFGFFVWGRLSAGRERDQMDIANLLARCCISKGFAPDTVLRDKHDERGFPWHVAGYVSDLFAQGSAEGICHTPLPLVNQGDISIDPDGVVDINTISNRNLLYVSYEMPTNEEMSAIERYIAENKAEKICFASIVGPESMQTPTRFSLIVR